MTTTPHIVFDNRTYVFKKYLGILLCYDHVTEGKGEVCHTEAYRYVENPYLLRHQTIVTTEASPSRWMRIYARLLVFVCRHAYVLTWIFRYITLPVFSCAGEANIAFYQMFPKERQRQLCLPRAIFTATMSKQFKQHGTLFIGAFLPTTRLHAWVIENGCHADAFDRQWIQYTPVLEWSWRKTS